MISLAGGKAPDYLSGRTLMGKNRSKLANHLVLSEDRSDNGIDMVRSVTNGKYMYSRNFMPFMPQARYIRYMEIGEIKQQMRKDLGQNKLNLLQRSLFEDRPAEFLFDIENDPWETKNLASEPAFKAVLEHMRSQLKKEILQSRDVMLLPEYQIGIISKTNTPYAFRLDDKNYPVAEIYNAASLSGFRGKDIVARQIKLLEDPNNSVRYWAIIGLRSQSQTDLKPYRKVIIEAMNDKYPPVAITAAAIIYKDFGIKVAEENLMKYCASKNMDLSLMAINYLLYIPNKQPFIETIQTVYKMKDRNYNVKAACLDFLGSLALVPNNTDYEK
jgi:hypothetical protein